MDPETLKALGGGASGLVKTITTMVGDYWGPLFKVKGQIRADEYLKAHLEMKAKLHEAAPASIEARAALSSIEQTEREQANLEGIAAHAIPLIGNNSGTPPSEEWSHNFRSKAREAHSDDIKVIWANLLKTEFLKSGTISRRTMNIIADIDIEDAKAFDLIRGCIFDDEFIYAVRDAQPLAYANVYSPVILKLIDARLIISDTILSLPSNAEWANGYKARYISFNNVHIAVYDKKSFKLDVLRLSEAGIALYKSTDGVEDLTTIRPVLKKMLEQGRIFAQVNTREVEQRFIILKDFQTLDDINIL